MTRVALEVGTEGQLGGTANVEGVRGEWKTLTDNVNTCVLVAPFSLYLGPEADDIVCVQDGSKLDEPSALDRGGHSSRRRGRFVQED